MRQSDQRSGGRRGPRALALVVVVLLLAAAVPVTTQAAPTTPSAADAPHAAQAPCTGGCSVPGALSLASVFPLAGDRAPPKRSDSEVVGLGDERADELLDALSSGTARDLLGRLIEEPRTPSELAAATGASVQNVHYHLGNLDDAGAVTVVDVEYSSRGREMSVYAATCRPQVTVYDLE